MRCRFCKKVKPILYKSYYTKKSGWRFICQLCNTARCNKYRQQLKGKLAVRKAVRRSTKKYPEKQRARQKVYDYIQAGKLVKPSVCSICGKKNKIEAHHTDYGRPLIVLWVCRSCHSDLEARRRVII